MQFQKIDIAAAIIASVMVATLGGVLYFFRRRGFL